MGFHDLAIFPERISQQSTGSPRWNTSVVKHDGGDRTALPRWTLPLKKFDARQGLRRQADVAEMLRFFHARIGATYGFRFKDWWDYATTTTGTLHNPGDAVVTASDSLTVLASTGLPGVGDATETQFQLVKRYENAGAERVKVIQKPSAASVVVSIDGTPQASGWTLDDTTGIVTFGTPPGSGLDVAAGFEFYTPCALSEETDMGGLEVQSVDFNANSMPSIIIEEIRGDQSIPEERIYGGSKVWGDMPVGVQVSLAAAAHRGTPTASGTSFFLPGTTGIPDGIGHFVFFNDSASETMTVKTGTVVVETLVPRSSCTVHLLKDDSNDLHWVSVT
jgi:uncharacterized protein (TIGR02217 family)